MVHLDFLNSKLKGENDSIFSVMSQLGQKYNAIDLSQGFPNFETCLLYTSPSPRD